MAASIPGQRQAVTMQNVKPARKDGDGSGGFKARHVVYCGNAPCTTECITVRP